MQSSNFDYFEIEYFERRLHDLSCSLNQKQDKIDDYQQRVNRLTEKHKEHQEKNHAFILQWRRMIEKSKVLRQYNLKLQISNERTDIQNKIEQLKLNLKHLEQNNGVLIATNIELLCNKHRSTKHIENLNKILESNDESAVNSQIQLIDKSHLYLTKQMELMKKQVQSLTQSMKRIDIQFHRNQEILTKIKKQTIILKERKTILTMKLLSAQLLTNQFNQQVELFNTVQQVDEDTKCQQNVRKYQLELIQNLKEIYDTEMNNKTKYQKYLNQLENIENGTNVIDLKTGFEETNSNKYETREKSQDNEAMEKIKDKITEQPNNNLETDQTRNDNDPEEEEFLIENYLTIEDN